jgi:hypothetical protein
MQLFLGDTHTHRLRTLAAWMFLHGFILRCVPDFGGNDFPATSGTRLVTLG